MASNDSEGGSFLPAAIAGVALLVVAGLYIFWPTGESAEHGEQTAKASASAQASGAPVGGGIPAAEVTNAARAGGAKAPQVRNMSGDPRMPEGINANETPEERLERLRKRLDAKKEHIKVIEGSLEKLPELREERVSKSSDPETTNEDFDKRKEKLEKNIEKAEKDMEFFEKEIARLEEELGVEPAAPEE